MAPQLGAAATRSASPLGAAATRSARRATSGARAVDGVPELRPRLAPERHEVVDGAVGRRLRAVVVERERRRAGAAGPQQVARGVDARGLNDLQQEHGVGVRAAWPAPRGPACTRSCRS